ncbi:MAG: hypothetical protein Q9214_004000 [Letrouitia sp. 1 TL-2023]
MLHEFHTYQNSRKPGSIRATYLISGQLAPLTPASPPTRPVDREDIHMQSSPFRSSPLPEQDGTEVNPLLKTVTLLEDVKRSYTQISSIHIYSLGPGMLKNLPLLTECNRAVFRKDTTEDLISIGKQYGVIQNSRVKLKQLQRRTTIQQQGVNPNPSQSANFGPKVVKQEPKSEAIIPSSTLSKNQTPDPSDPKPFPQPEQAKKNEKNQGPRSSGIKKEPSNIFKSFSKPKAKPESEKTNSGGETRQDTSKHETKTKTDRTRLNSDEDEPMKDASEDEQSEDFTETTTKAQQTSQSRRKAKLQTEERLRKLMDDDDDDDTSANSQQHNAPQAEEPDTADIPATREETPAETAPAAGGTRRRGRRKVMKKKMLKDEEGYLVTKEEPVWESFSEDEPAPKARLPASTNPPPASKGKKSAGGKAEQGNIMSFFGKK